MDKEFNFRVIYTTNNEHIYINYVGLPKKENINYEKIKNFAKDKLKAINVYKCPDEAVITLKTIFKDFEEEELTIRSYVNDNKELHLTSVKNIFTRIEQRDKIEQQKIEILYTRDDTTITLSNENKASTSKIIDYLETELPKKIRIINNLQNINIKGLKDLTKDEKILCEIYRIFYQETPDFMDEDSNIKVQSMMSILRHFGVSLGDAYSFRYFDNYQTPISLKLSSLVRKLSLLGKIDNIEDNITLKKKIKKTIEIVRDSIKEYANEKELIEVMPSISRILHSTAYNSSELTSLDCISEFTKCTTDEILSSRKLVKKINYQLTNED